MGGSGKRGWIQHDTAWADRSEAFYRAHPEFHASFKFLWELTPPGERPHNFDFEWALAWVKDHPEAAAQWETENARIVAATKKR